jgi:hypothetical protein
MNFVIQSNDAQRTLGHSKSYRALVMLFKDILENAQPSDFHIKPTKADILTFVDWLEGLASNLPAYFGVMWMHIAIGRIAVPDNSEHAKSLNQSNLLNDFLTTLDVLAEVEEDEASLLNYQNMVVQAWTSVSSNISNNAKKDEYVKRLDAILNQQALAESFDLWHALGLSKSKALMLIEVMHAKLSSEWQRRERQYSRFSFHI